MADWAVMSFGALELLMEAPRRSCAEELGEPRHLRTSGADGPVVGRYG